jgi:hypothetical protein
MEDIDSTNEIVTTEEQAPVDRKELLSQQFDEVEKAEPEKPAVATPPKPTAGRDANGKFVSTAPVTPEVAEAPVWKRPPSSWKKEFHEVWNTADPRLQEYAFQREEQMRAGVQPLLSKAEFADSVQKVVEPYISTIKGMGIDAPTAIKGLLEADHILRYSEPPQKLAYLQQLARHYGVDLGQMAGNPQPGAAPDSNFYALANQLNEVRGEIKTWKEQQEAIQNQALSSEVLDFAQKNEHFDAARPTMISLLQSNQAETLEEAYKKALRLDDNLFEMTQAAKQAEVVSSKRAAADKAAKSARAAAVSVRSSTPGTHTATKAQDRRSMLLEQFDNLSERL